MSIHKQSCEYAGCDSLASRYLAEWLSPQEADAFEAHYFACDNCWQRVRRALELRAAFAGAQAV